MTVARPPAVASRRARARRRAAAFSSSRGSRVPVAARGRVAAGRRPRGRPGRRWLRAAFSAARWAALPGGKAGGGARSAATAAAIAPMASAMASASVGGDPVIDRGRAGRRRGRCRGCGTSGGRAGSWCGRRRRRSAWNCAPGGAQPRRGAPAPMTASTLAATGAVSAGSRMPASRAGEDQGGGAAGLAGGGGGGAGGGEVVEDELGDGGAQPAAVAGAAGDLGGLDAGFFQHGGRPGTRRRARRGLAGQGVGGVGALVGQGAPGDRVAVAVGGAGGVGRWPG